LKGFPKVVGRDSLSRWTHGEIINTPLAAELKERDSAAILFILVPAAEKSPANLNI
jgi:hypothetical protein